MKALAPTVLLVLLAIGVCGSALVTSAPASSGSYGTCVRPIPGNNVLVDCAYKGLYANQYLLLNNYYWHPGKGLPTTTFQLSRRTFVRTTSVADTGCTVYGIAQRSQTLRTAPKLACAGLGRLETDAEQHSIADMYRVFCEWVAANPPLFQIPAAEHVFCALPTPTPTPPPGSIPLHDTPCTVTLTGQQHTGACTGTFRRSI